MGWMLSTTPRFSCTSFCHCEACHYSCVSKWESWQQRSFLPCFCFSRIGVHFILQSALVWVIFSRCPLCVVIFKSYLVAFPQAACCNWKFPSSGLKSQIPFFSFNLLLKIFFMSKLYKQGHKCLLMPVGLHLGCSACLPPSWLLTTWLPRGTCVYPVPRPDCWWSPGTQTGLGSHRFTLAGICSLQPGDFLQCVHVQTAVKASVSQVIRGNPCQEKLWACASSVRLLIYG